MQEVNVPSTPRVCQSSPDEEDLSHVRRPVTLFRGGNQQRYARLQELPPELPTAIATGTPRVQQVRVNSTTAPLSPKLHAAGDESALGALTTDDDDPPCPCVASPLLLCFSLMGMVFILCSCALGISLGMQTNRSQFVAQYNAVVNQWDNLDRDIFARETFQVQLQPQTSSTSVPDQHGVIQSAQPVTPIQKILSVVQVDPSASFLLGDDSDVRSTRPHNFTSLLPVTSGDVLNDMGDDVARYQPYYFALDVPPNNESDNGDANVNSTADPPAWIERDDFSVNATFVNLVATSSDAAERSSLTVVLPFLLQDVSRTTASTCTSKLQGLFDVAEDTCLSFRQLTAVCVRVKRMTAPELIDAGLTNSTSTQWVFDTAAIDSPGSDPVGTTGHTDDPRIDTSWTDALGSASVRNARSPPGCIRHVQLGWKVGVYTSVPVTKYTAAKAATGKHAGWQPVAYQPRLDQDRAPIAFSLAAASDSHEPDTESDDGPDDAPSDLLLVGVDLASFSLSVRSRHDPYLMAQSLTRSSLWFGLPPSELILFIVVLGALGVIMEIAPLYFTASWYALRKDREEQAKEEEARADTTDDEDEEEEEEEAADDKPRIDHVTHPADSEASDRVVQLTRVPSSRGHSRQSSSNASRSTRSSPAPSPMRPFGGLLFPFAPYPTFDEHRARTPTVEAAETNLGSPNAESEEEIALARAIEIASDEDTSANE